MLWCQVDNGKYGIFVLIFISSCMALLESYCIPVWWCKVYTKLFSLKVL